MHKVMIMVLVCLSVIPLVSNAATDKAKLTVAILDFDSEEKGNITLGSKVATLLEATLNPGGEYELVERSNIKKMLEEIGLGMTGILKENTAAKIGSILGAKVLIAGRVFSVDEDMFIAAKIISVETGRVFGEAVSIDKKSQKLGDGVANLSVKVNNALLQNAPLLIAVVEDPVDTIEIIREALGKAKRPAVSVSGIERHVGRAIIDPASITELKYILLKTDFVVYDDDPKVLSAWAKEYFRDSSTPFPNSPEKADVILITEAISEFAARTEGIISCKARVEARVIDSKTGKLLSIERKTVTEPGLSEEIAAKTAIQKATEDIAATLLPEAVKKWNEGLKE